MGLVCRAVKIKDGKRVCIDARLRFQRIYVSIRAVLVVFLCRFLIEEGASIAPCDFGSQRFVDPEDSHKDIGIRLNDRNSVKSGKKLSASAVRHVNSALNVEVGS